MFKIIKYSFIQAYLLFCTFAFIIASAHAQNDEFKYKGTILFPPDGKQLCNIKWGYNENIGIKLISMFKPTGTKLQQNMLCVFEDDNQNIFGVVKLIPPDNINPEEQLLMFQPPPIILPDTHKKLFKNVICKCGSDKIIIQGEQGELLMKILDNVKPNIMPDKSSITAFMLPLD